MHVTDGDISGFFESLNVHWLTFSGYVVDAHMCAVCVVMTAELATYDTAQAVDDKNTFIDESF